MSSAATVTDMEAKKKLPAVRWTEKERLLLIEEVLKVERVLFGKLSGSGAKGSVTTAEKSSMWASLAIRINAIADVPKSGDQCKKQYDNIRQRAKEKVDSVRKTGGGPPENATPSQAYLLDHTGDRPGIIGLSTAIDTEETVDAAVPSTSSDVRGTTSAGREAAVLSTSSDVRGTTSAGREAAVPSTSSNVRGTTSAGREAAVPSTSSDFRGTTSAGREAAVPSTSSDVRAKKKNGETVSEARLKGTKRKKTFAELELETLEAEKEKFIEEKEKLKLEKEKIRQEIELHRLKIMYYSFKTQQMCSEPFASSFLES